MIQDTTETFNAYAADYDAARRRLIPPFERFYGAAVDGAGAGAGVPARILDLGAGTGLLTRLLLRAFPGSHVTMLDGADGMLDEARRAIADEHPGADVAYMCADLADELPRGPWDAIVSALAIHHLEDARKRDLLARAQVALTLGGVFVNADQVAAPTTALARRYLAWHEAEARRAGSSEQEWSDAVKRMSHDRCSTVEEQLRWLGEAGFTDVDCVFKEYGFAVMLARAPAPAQLRSHRLERLKLSL